VNKNVKRGIWFFAIAILVAVIANIGFTVFNTVGTPMTNQLALGQMTNDDSVADTVGRMSAEGKLWGIVQYICNGVAVIFGTIGLVNFAKAGYNYYKENA